MSLDYGTLTIVLTDTNLRCSHVTGSTSLLFPKNILEKEGLLFSCSSLQISPTLPPWSTLLSFFKKRPRPDFIDKATRQRHGYHRFTGNHNHTEEFKRNLSKHDTGNCHTQRAGRGGERPNVRKRQHQIIRQGSSRISEKSKPEFC